MVLREYINNSFIPPESILLFEEKIKHYKFHKVMGDMTYENFMKLNTEVKYLNEREYDGHLKLKLLEEKKLHKSK